MGFDIYGIKPNNQDKPDSPNWDDEEQVDAYFAWQENTNGAYFRNNVWWWRPLWDFVCNICNDFLTEKDMEGGCYNDGVKISKTKAKKIATRLKAVDKFGGIEEYEQKYHQTIESYNLIDCELCGGTGTRNDKNVKGDCNACNTEHTKKEGIPVGKIKPLETNYPFNAENVRNFAKFCDHSGGFQIC